MSASDIPTRGGLAVLSSASAGGAGIAARRMASAMIAHSSFQTDFIDGTALGAILPEDVSKQSSFSNHTISDTHFTYEYPGYSRGWVIDLLRSYDVLNIQWASYLLSLAELDALSSTGKPIFFTAHDFHYLTGGCHYPADCSRFHTDCRNCPQIDRSRISPARIASNHAIKRKIFARPNVHLIAPSVWLHDHIVAAGIVPPARAHVVRNPYVAENPPILDRKRDPLRILLIADSLYEGRKQMPLALEALALLVTERAAKGGDPNITVDLVGRSDKALLAGLRTAGVPHKSHGRIVDNHARLSQIFARTDIMLTCSNEDNWPNILVETGAYGALPIVGPGHGCAEFVQRYNFGEIASDYTAPAFAAAITRGIECWRKEAAAKNLEKIRADHAPQVAAQAMDTLLKAALDASASQYPSQNRRQSQDVRLSAI